MHPVKTYHRKPLKGERVWLEVVRMSDIPVGDDPATHDSYNTHTNLTDGWSAATGEQHEDDKGMAYLNLANQLSGQRLELMMWPELVIPDNKATAAHPFHLSFSTLGGAHYQLGYESKEEAVAAMVEFSLYRNVFRLSVMRRGMSLCPVQWTAGDQVLTDIDQYHAAVSWGDCEVVLATQGEEQVSEVWMEKDATQAIHMCLACPACGDTLRSLQDMRGMNVQHQCSQTKLTSIWVPNDVQVLKDKPGRRDLPHLPDLPDLLID